MADSSSSGSFWNRLGLYFKNYFSLQAYIEKQSDIESDIRQSVSFRGTNSFILVLAIFVASLGLNTNSTAVIIGAMLISPLMGPIIGMGLAVGIEDFALLKTALRNLAMATVISMATSTLFFLISPVAEGHSELLARTSPTIYDVLIAFFGGGAGIIGLASRNKGNVIPGVAIATALMPPLCTAGYGLATGQMNYFLGASYLYLINSIFIALATFIGVKLLHFKSAPVTDADRARRVRRIVYIVAVLTLLPSLYMTYEMLQRSRFDIEAQRFVAAECVFPATQVVSYKATKNPDGEKVINITLLGRILPEDSLVRTLESRLRYYNLEGTAINVFQGDMPVMAANVSDDTSKAAIYSMAQRTLEARQQTIDSLQARLAAVDAPDTIVMKIAPELRVVFPQVSSMSIVHPVTYAVGDTKQKPDTTTVAIVSYSRRVSNAEVEELQRYLAARLSCPQLRLLIAY